jgi:hypothetical protein
MVAPQKVKKRTPILLLGISLKECKSAHSRDAWTPRFMAALFTIIWN